MCHNSWCWNAHWVLVVNFVVEVVGVKVVGL